MKLTVRGLGLGVFRCKDLQDLLYPPHRPILTKSMPGGRSPASGSGLRQLADGVQQNDNVTVYTNYMVLPNNGESNGQEN